MAYDRDDLKETLWAAIAACDEFISQLRAHNSVYQRLIDRREDEQMARVAEEIMESVRDRIAAIRVFRGDLIRRLSSI